MNQFYDDYMFGRATLEQLFKVCYSVEDIAKKSDLASLLKDKSLLQKQSAYYNLDLDSFANNNSALLYCYFHKDFDDYMLGNLSLDDLFSIYEGSKFFGLQFQLKMITVSKDTLSLNCDYYKLNGDIVLQKIESILNKLSEVDCSLSL